MIKKEKFKFFSRYSIIKIVQTYFGENSCILIYDNELE